MTDPDAFWFVGERATILVRADDNPAGLSVVDHRMAHDFAPPLHVHHHEDETFHILAGRFRFEADGEATEAGAGESFTVRAGVRHGFRVLSPEGGRMLTLTTGGFEQAIRAVSVPAVGDTPPPANTPTPAMQVALAQRFAAHGIELLGPPIA